MDNVEDGAASVTSWESSPWPVALEMNNAPCPATKTGEAENTLFHLPRFKDAANAPYDKFYFAMYNSSNSRSL